MQGGHATQAFGKLPRPPDWADVAVSDEWRDTPSPSRPTPRPATLTVLETADKTKRSNGMLDVSSSPGDQERDPDKVVKVSLKGNPEGKASKVSTREDSPHTLQGSSPPGHLDELRRSAESWSDSVLARQIGEAQELCRGTVWTATARQGFASACAVLLEVQRRRCGNAR